MKAKTIWTCNKCGQEIDMLIDRGEVVHHNNGLICDGKFIPKEWVSLDEHNELADFTMMLWTELFASDCPKERFKELTDRLGEFFPSPSPLVACKKPLTKAKEGRAKRGFVKEVKPISDASLALPKSKRKVK